jgi:hypothetical protein
MISPAIAGNDSRYGMALRVFLGELSAMSCQYLCPIGELSVKRFSATSASFRREGSVESSAGAGVAGQAGLIDDKTLPLAPEVVG